METNELKDIAPILNKLKSASLPFDLPDRYFDALEDQLSLQVNLECQVDKEKGFGVPNDYFSNLESKVLNRIKSEIAVAKKEIQPELKSDFTHKKSKKDVFYLNQTLKTLFAPMAVAACFLLFFSIFYKASSSDFAKLPDNEIGEWLSLEIEEINSLEILSVYNEVTIDAYASKIDLQTDELENYLILDDIESIILEN